MERLRSVLERLFATNQEEFRADGGRPAGPSRIFECNYCGCTGDTGGVRCQECRVGRLVPGGEAFESKPGFTCRICHASVDYRYELCPECGSQRFEGAK